MVARVTSVENQSNIIVVEDLESQRDSCVVVEIGETKRGREEKKKWKRECVWCFEREYGN